MLPQCDEAICILRLQLGMNFRKVRSIFGKHFCRSMAKLQRILIGYGFALTLYCVCLYNYMLFSPISWSLHEGKISILNVLTKRTYRQFRKNFIYWRPPNGRNF